MSDYTLLRVLGELGDRGPPWVPELAPPLTKSSPESPSTGARWAGLVYTQEARGPSPAAAGAGPMFLQLVNHYQSHPGC